jgi:hypothetical protein
MVVQQKNSTHLGANNHTYKQLADGILQFMNGVL